jgi:signal transduction histidine kinase
MDLWHFTPVAIIYFVTSGISFLLAFLAWNMRRIRAAGLFSIMMLFVGIWVTASLLGVFSMNFSLKILMLKFEYVGMAGSVYLWLVFVAEYTQYNKWLKKWVYPLLALIPAITLFHVFQAPEDTHIHMGYYLNTVNGISVFEKNFGGGFFLWASYAYLLMLIGVVFLVMRIIQTPKVMRKQLILLIPAVFVVMLPNILFITKNNPIEPFDPTPLALAVVGILFLSTFYFFQFLNVVPVAHNLVFKNVRAGVIIVNSKNLILELNPLAEAIIGEEQDLIVGRDLFQVIPECKEILVNASEDDEITINLSKRSYELKVTLLKDSSSNPQGRIIMLWDITDQQMAMKELDAYARTVAHDLKTPLGHMMGFAQLLKENDISEKERNDYLQNILDGGEKIKNIIDGLLMLAKIRNQEKIELSLISMPSIMHSVLARLNSSIEKHSVSINLPKTWETALGNSIWVEEVWVNLLTNAIKYGGKPPVINIASVKSEKYIWFSLSDNGNGLSLEEQEQIFEEFTRIHPSKDSIKGHGLGLSIVQRIIKKMGGEVSVESKPGEGCTFSFTLPAG